MTQVVVVERLCDAEAGPAGLAAAGLGDHETSAGTPSRADAVALGSIVAAAWSNPAVPRAAALVSRDVALPSETLARATALGRTPDGGSVWSDDELLASARLEAFSRWLAAATHTRVRLSTGYEHPGDSSQPDNLHRH